MATETQDATKQVRVFPKLLDVLITFSPNPETYAETITAQAKIEKFTPE